MGEFNQLSLRADDHSHPTRRKRRD
jgi:hypothetical protein